MHSSKRLYRAKSVTLGSLDTIYEEEDQSMRLCIDYRELKKITIINQDPLPNVDDLIAQVQGASVFSMIGLRMSYQQLHIKTENISETTSKHDIGILNL